MKTMVMQRVFLEHECIKFRWNEPEAIIVVKIGSVLPPRCEEQ
jgi:hypothetical protein